MGMTMLTRHFDGTKSLDSDIHSKNKKEGGESLLLFFVFLFGIAKCDAIVSHLYSTTYGALGPASAWNSALYKKFFYT